MRYRSCPADSLEQLNNKEIQNVLATITNLILEINQHGRIKRIIPSGYRFSFFKPDFLIGQSLISLLHKSEEEHFEDKIKNVLAKDCLETLEVYYHHKKTNQKKWFHINLSRLSPDSVLAVLQDITSLKNTQDQLERREHYYLSLINNSSDLITIVDQHGRILFESPAVEKILDYRPEDLIGTTFLSHIHDDDHWVCQSNIFKTNQEVSTMPFEFRRRDKNGSWLYFEGIASNLVEDKDINGIIINSRNINEKKYLELEQQRHLFEDPLTGLANRTRLMDRIDQSLQRMNRLKNHHFALILANLDRFKMINESLGHDLADKLLQTIGTLLKEHFRKIDTISRIGGDEFALLIDSVTDDTDPLRIAERLSQELQQIFSIQGYEITTSVSIGIVFSSDRYTNPDQILRDAATAVNKAKNNPSASYRVFKSHMHEQALNKLKIEADLRKALENLEFEIHFQPIFNIFSPCLFGLEALLRWHHPDKGMISPLDFISLAEETGLIVPIGKWVLTEACSQVQKLQDLRKKQDPLILCVNISAKQLSEDDLNSHIQKVLFKTGFDPNCLELEITESALINNISYASKVLRQLKKVGLKLSIDDFGTGYSSLSYLHNLPFDTLKIDRSFVSSLNGNSNKNEKIIQSIMSLANNLEMKVIAEGIENYKQMEKMKNYLCHYAQGFYLCRPYKLEELMNKGII